MSRYPISRQTLGLAGWLLLTFAAAAAGAAASAEAGAFYLELARPDWAPPAWLFAPVWTALYVLIGLAAWLVWRAHGWRGARIALALFVVQLAANALWTWLFFAWRLGGLAFAEILLLWCLIAATVAAFLRLRERTAALLLLPYLAWVSFACALTFSIWQLNPERLAELRQARLVKAGEGATGMPPRARSWRCSGCGSQMGRRPGAVAEAMRAPIFTRAVARMK